MAYISIILPCFNEEAHIELIKSVLDDVLKNHKVEYIFIDDGSTDNTLNEIMALAIKDDRVKYISFSRNFGHQYALKAGFDYAEGECVITMDADMQHNPELIPKMLEKWKEGFDIVYTIKKNASRISFFKKATAGLYNCLFAYFSDLKKQSIGADYRLIDKRIVIELKNNFQEYHLFYRGLFNWMGYNQIGIEYETAERYSGKSKYTYTKMGRLALDGITSFSIKPLRLISWVGLFFAGFSFLYGLYALYIHFFTDRAITGWTSVILSVLFIGGIQLLFMGIIGEYIGKLFFEIKKRPHYLVKKKNV